jgi:hypothetical protein
MARETDAMTDESEIESTLDFDVERYADDDPFERVAVGSHEWRNRRVEYVYELSTEVEDDTQLSVNFRYYLNGELVAERPLYGPGETYPVENGRVMHTSTGQELVEFIEANFNADPAVSVTDEFESAVDE